MGDSRAGQVLGQLHRWLGPAATPVEDGPLLERFVRQRDEDAFAQLVGRHGPLVFGLCRRLLGNVQDAEDVFQATFLVLARKAASIRKPESLSSWLHGVAYRLALKAKAEIERRHIHEQQAALPADIPEIDLSWREVRGLLDEELQRLPEKQRLPLILCYLEGLTQDEAARRLGWPRGTLKRRLEDGRERLRLRLTRRGVTLGAGLFAIALSESATKGAVPTALRSVTVQAAMQFATHETAILAATPAMMLANGALQTMVTTKLKLGAMAILLFCCAVTAAGLAIPQAQPEKQPKNKVETPAQSIKDKQVRKDRYGDPLPPGAIARLGTVRLRHQSPTSSAVFTRDGKTAIVGDYGGSIVYWDVATAREVRRLQRMLGAIEALAISRDGKTLASSSEGQVCLWEVATGKLFSQSQSRVGTYTVEQIIFTPDGKTLVLRDQGSAIHLWDVVGNKKLLDLKGHKEHVICMALSPDGKTLASGDFHDPHFRLWDIAAGKEKRRSAAHGSGIMSLAYSSDGKTLAAIGNLAGLAFFDPKSGELLAKPKESFGGVHQIAYAPDGKTLIGIGMHNVYVLDAAGGKHLRRFDAPPRLMAGLTISPDGKTVATFWGGPHTFDLWDVASGKLLHPAPGHHHSITSLVFSADGQQLFSAAGISDFPLQVWDVRTGERLYELGDNPNSVNKLALSPDGKLLAAFGYNDSTIRLWDPAGRKEVRVFKGHTGFGSVAWSADGKTLASATGGEEPLRLWDPATGKQRLAVKLYAQGLGPATVALSPDNKTVAVGGFEKGRVRLFSVETGKEVRSVRTPQQIVYTVAFSPDGSALACGGISDTIQLWAPASGRLLRQWITKTRWISDLAFARDGRTLVSGHDDGSVHLWEPATGKERACFRGHRGGVRSVAISRDGRYIASGSEDTTILVWDAAAAARADAALPAEQLRSLWDDLDGGDAGRAYRALWQLAVSPKHALPFLAERLRPVAPLDAMRQKQVDRLLAELDSDRFTVRQQAEFELERKGLRIEPVLHQALESKPSLEVRRRIEKILAKLASERLRITRALEAIEHMNTPEAERLLLALADGAPHAWLTEEARTICKRLAKQSRTVPQR